MKALVSVTADGYRIEHSCEYHSDRNAHMNNTSVQELHAAYEDGLRDGAERARADAEANHASGVILLLVGAVSGAIVVGALWAAVAVFH